MEKKNKTLVPFSEVFKFAFHLLGNNTDMKKPELVHENRVTRIILISISIHNNNTTSVV